MTSVRQHRQLGQRVIAGLAWMLVQNASARFLALGAQLVLARILAPDDFGVLALATTITAVVSVATTFGMDEVVLQRNEQRRYWMQSFFTLNLALAIFGMATVSVLAPTIARIYDVGLLTPFLLLSAASIPLAAVGNAPSVELRSRLQFRRVAALNLAEVGAAQVMTIALALAQFGALSFALPLPVIAAAKSASLWVLAPVDLSVGMRIAQVKLLVRRSGAVFGRSLMATLQGQADYVVIGLVASVSQVGAYYFAFRLAVQPVQLLAGNFTGVLLPALARLRRDTANQARAALNAARGLSFALMPIGVLQAVLAGPILTLLVGERWAPAVPLLQILSVGLACDGVAWVAGALLASRGEYFRALLYTLALTPAFFCLIFIGAWFFGDKALGVALGVGAYHALVTPVYSVFVFGRAGVGATQVLGAYLAPLGYALMAFGGATCLVGAAGLDSIVGIGAVTVLGGASYIVLIRVFSPSDWRLFIELLANAVRARASRNLPLVALKRSDV